MAVELELHGCSSQFGGKFDIELLTAVFDYPTIGELAAHLVCNCPDSDTSPDRPNPRELAVDAP